MYINPHFKKTTRIFPEPGRYGYARFDMNENPEGLPFDFVEKIKTLITPEFLATYPESASFVRKYADFIGVEPENVMTTNGSDMGIRYLMETFGKPGSKVVTVSPTFEMYRINCSLLGLQHVPVPYEEDFQFKPEKILDAIDEQTSIVVVLNPNNPIGNVFSAEEVENIITKARNMGSLVIIDEAYHYFHETTFLSFVKLYDNVVLLRTFSKCFSIAACRLGVILGSKTIIQAVTNGRLTFDVNALALLFGEALLETPQMLQQLIKLEKEGKKYLTEQLDNNGYTYMGGAGNYIFIKPKRIPETIFQILKSNYKVLVKTFGHPLLKDYIRVSTGSTASMKRFLQAFLQADKI